MTVYIGNAVGDENIIIFGMHTPEVMSLRKNGYNPHNYIENNPLLKECLEFIKKGIGGQSFEPIYNTLINVDYYMALADFSDYCTAQDKVSKLYADRDAWNKMSLINIAESGIFAADRSIEDYARDIWNIKPIV